MKTPFSLSTNAIFFNTRGGISLSDYSIVNCQFNSNKIKLEIGITWAVVAGAGEVYGG